MDITSIEGASAFQAALAQERIGMAVLAKSMDVARQQGQHAIALIEGAAESFEALQTSNSRQLDVKA